MDAARLLLILTTFSKRLGSAFCEPVSLPSHPVVAYFTPEYYLHKLDFLLRYPSYFAYELTELHRLGKSAAANREEVIQVIREIFRNREPEIMTQHFRRFWRGAYERADLVEALWWGRELVYCRSAHLNNSPPQKYYFLSEEAFTTSERLVSEVPGMDWYSHRVGQLRKFYADLSPSQVKRLQYQHEQYREAQLNELIPDLSAEEVAENFKEVFEEELEESVA